ncbi:MAG TPA: hypothetical protein VGS17_10380 [Candidatus Limnocylindria bacterium]|nr:hypothetical protein [Candidatus Limnocylindria bacterium]
MRAIALGMGIVVLTGVALATPVAVLRVAAQTRDRTRIVPLADGEHYEYSYQQSIYQVQVVEEHVRNGDTLSIVRVRSRDLRAVEYFRWDGQIRREGDEFVQDAPPNSVPALMIRITTEGTQGLRGAAFDIVLREELGDTVVTVTPQYVPRLLALLGRP